MSPALATRRVILQRPQIALDSAPPGLRRRLPPPSISPLEAELPEDGSQVWSADSRPLAKNMKPPPKNIALSEALHPNGLFMQPPGLAHPLPDCPWKRAELIRAAVPRRNLEKAPEEQSTLRGQLTDEEQRASAADEEAEAAFEAAELVWPLGVEPGVAVALLPYTPPSPSSAARSPTTTNEPGTTVAQHQKHASEAIKKAVAPTIRTPLRVQALPYRPKGVVLDE